MELSASYLVDYFSFPRFLKSRLTSHPFCTYLELKDRKQLLSSPILLASRIDEIYYTLVGATCDKTDISTWLLMPSLPWVTILEKLPQHVVQFLTKSRDCWCQSQASFWPNLCFLNSNSFASFWPQDLAGVSPAFSDLRPQYTSKGLYKVVEGELINKHSLGDYWAHCGKSWSNDWSFTICPAALSFLLPMLCQTNLRYLQLPQNTTSYFPMGLCSLRFLALP